MKLAISTACLTAAITFACPSTAGLGAQDLLAALPPTETVHRNIVLDHDKKIFYVGQDLVVNIKPERRVPNLRVRVFRGNRTTLQTHPQLLAPDDCWLYASAVLTPIDQNGKLNFGQLDQMWLGLDGSGRIKNEVFVLRFATGDVPDGPVKIHKDHVKDYFADGYEIIVGSREDLPKTVAAKIKKYFDDKGREASSYAEKGKCIELTRSSDRPRQFAYADGCGTPNAASDGGV